jgi:rubrerythrin
MTMDRKILTARIRQILAIDKNALDIYSELSKSVKDDIQRKLISGIAADEKRHVALDEEMLALLEK